MRQFPFACLYDSGETLARRPVEVVLAQISALCPHYVQDRLRRRPLTLALQSDVDIFVVNVDSNARGATCGGQYIPFQVAHDAGGAGEGGWQLARPPDKHSRLASQRLLHQRAEGGVAADDN